ncbi:hypothetical protein VB713_21205 [Anabaena cylindrica UHCC 0172]|uniref:hypothetical protein n=1 Tax=Anabaena cylindrica TaxID=1165 RepID=UPI002B213E13|nr:hypothetical protein [Anabaena cylindrica]MEA5553460.1 hypothetical protein [Anabaena cylindrica UHCC 0172]
MNRKNTQRVIAKCDRYAVFVLTFDFTAVLDWCFDIEILKKGFFSSPATMKANTALCFF